MDDLGGGTSIFILSRISSSEKDTKKRKKKEKLNGEKVTENITFCLINILIK